MCSKYAVQKSTKYFCLLLLMMMMACVFFYGSITASSYKVQYFFTMHNAPSIHFGLKGQIRDGKSRDEQSFSVLLPVALPYFDARSVPHPPPP